MRSIILYFGSFNPVHNGHISIAEYVLDRGLSDELWFIVSPQNPMKPEDSLICEDDRLEMVKLAITGSRYPDKMKASDIEFDLPRPSYTIDTMEALNRLYPDCSFTLLFGSDIIPGFHRWKQWQRLITDYKIYIYPRRGYNDTHQDEFTILRDAPYFDYSSTEIRRLLENGADVSGMVPRDVIEYIKNNKLWISTNS